MEYVALRSYEPSAYSTGQLSFNEGDIIYVTAKSLNGQWEGMCQGRSGSFPSVLVRPRYSSTNGSAVDDAEDSAEGGVDGDYDVGELGGYPNEPPPSFDAPHQAVGL